MCVCGSLSTRGLLLLFSSQIKRWLCDLASTSLTQDGNAFGLMFCMGSSCSHMRLKLTPHCTNTQANSCFLDLWGKDLFNNPMSSFYPNSLLVNTPSEQLHGVVIEISPLQRNKPSFVLTNCVYVNRHDQTFPIYCGDFSRITVVMYLIEIQLHTSMIG